MWYFWLLLVKKEAIFNGTILSPRFKVNFLSSKCLLMEFMEKKHLVQSDYLLLKVWEVCLLWPYFMNHLANLKSMNALYKLLCSRTAKDFFTATLLDMMLLLQTGAMSYVPIPFISILLSFLHTSLLNALFR